MVRALKARLATGLALALAAALASTVQAAASQLIRISSDPYTNATSQHRTQVEPDTFSFGNTVVATFQSGRFFDGGASNIGWATSRDDGTTWTHGFLPDTTVYASPAGPWARISDPSVTYDAKHKVWMISSLAIASNGVGASVLVSRSTDGGLTWGNPVTVHLAGPSDFLDKEWVVCDDTSTSPFYGNCYTEWDNFANTNLVQMSTSKNGGKSWGAAKTTPDHACVIGGQPLVQPNGTVIVPIDDCFETAVLSFRSTDGGDSWSRVVLAAQILTFPEPGGLRDPFLPSAEIDGAGTVYVVWQDCRFEAPNCATNDIVMTTSTDGVNWSLVKRIPIDARGSGIDHFIPGLAVDRNTAGSGAHLGLAFYYYPNAWSGPNFSTPCTTTGANACKLDVGFVSSANGGANWSSKEKLAGDMSLAWLANTNQGWMVGDYISSSISRQNHVSSVFEVANPPTGSVKDEATYATGDETVGGVLVPDVVPVVTSVPRARALIRHTAQ